MRNQIKKSFYTGIKVVFTSFLLYFFLPINTAHAYLDPGTGSFILQMIFAAFVSFMFAIKVYWRKIKTFMGKLFTKNNTVEINDEDKG